MLEYGKLCVTHTETIILTQHREPCTNDIIILDDTSALEIIFTPKADTGKLYCSIVAA